MVIWEKYEKPQINQEKNRKDVYHLLMSLQLPVFVEMLSPLPHDDPLRLAKARLNSDDCQSDQQALYWLNDKDNLRW